jgi:carotenoid cleavage dioxygenase
LWALNEAGPPFQFRLGCNGAIHSIGFDTMDGTQEAPISAHPKFCARTRETWFHGRQLEKRTAYIGRAIGGKVVEKAQIKPLTGFNHDMFLTENYAVLIDGSMRFSPKNVATGGPLWAFSPKFKLKFGIFKRHEGPLVPEAIKWIEASFCAEIVHTLFAYEEDSKIVLWAPVAYHLPGMISGNSILGECGPFIMRKLTIDTNNGTVDVHDVEGAENLLAEFPRFRDDRSCLDCRYGFSGVQTTGDFEFTGIAKWDMREGRLAGEIKFADGVVGGEPIFFPRDGSAPDADGDNGYVGLLLRNHVGNESTFAIFDAGTFSNTPVCELLIPRRVSLGFHAAWITEEQFQKQLELA